MRIQYKSKLLDLLKIKTSTSDYIDKKLACQPANCSLQSLSDSLLCLVMGCCQYSITIGNQNNI